MATSDAYVVLNQPAIDSLADDPQTLAAMLEAAKPVVDKARFDAPRRSGLGAASIQAQPFSEIGGEQTVHISWDREHYYLGFHELGTVQLPARHFLEDALEGQAR